MKKMMMTAMMILVAALCCFAETHTHTITLISRVEKQDAQYAIRSHETGEVGSSIVYSTSEIAKSDVRTSFDVIRSHAGNGINRAEFTVSATELAAVVDGRLYSTDGVQIVMDGIQCGSSVSFTRITAGYVAAGTVVAGFEVIWPTSENLVQATYEASVTLTAVAF